MRMPGFTAGLALVDETKPQESGHGQISTNDLDKRDLVTPSGPLLGGLCALYMASRGHAGPHPLCIVLSIL